MILVMIPSTTIIFLLCFIPLEISKFIVDIFSLSKLPLKTQKKQFQF